MTLALAVRRCDPFLRRQECVLGSYGFLPDPGQVTCTTTDELLVYHYTHPKHLHAVLTHGLRARLPVVSADHLPYLRGRYLVEAWLEPLPRWLTTSPYFGDFGYRLMQQYVGKVLLEVRLPATVAHVYVAEAAHNFSCKYQHFHGQAVLELGYDCRTGQEVCRAEANSYIPIQRYAGGHLAPNVKITRLGQGIAVPPQAIHICNAQPLAI